MLYVFLYLLMLQKKLVRQAQRWKHNFIFREFKACLPLHGWTDQSQGHPYRYLLNLSFSFFKWCPKDGKKLHSIKIFKKLLTYQSQKQMLVIVCQDCYHSYLYAIIHFIFSYFPLNKTVKMKQFYTFRK